MKKVTVLGGGVLGSQIATQLAFCDFDTTVWLRSEDSIKRAEPKFKKFREVYLAELKSLYEFLGTDHEAPRGFNLDLKNLKREQLDELIEKTTQRLNAISFVLEPKEALSDAEFLIETMTEDPQAKKELYEKLSPYISKDAILLTNSSTLLPSMFRDFVPNPENYLALHFANNIWRNNIAEVMGHDGTSKEAYEKTVQFAKDMGMTPLELKKEQPGYIINSLLVPLLSAAQALHANGVADFQTIDKTWRLATGSPLGPFQILDIVGLKTAYQVVSINPKAQVEGSTESKVLKILKSYIDQGKLGVASGEGFYKYS